MYELRRFPLHLWRQLRRLAHADSSGANGRMVVSRSAVWLRGSHSRSALSTASGRLAAVIADSSLGSGCDVQRNPRTHR
jgi:hypothetical protein